METKVSNSEVIFPNTLQEIIEGCKKGDLRAQLQIFKMYYKVMYNTSLRIVNNTAEAEDIMQEAFLLAFVEIENYSGTVSFEGWLKQIVQNRSLEITRKRIK